MSSRNASVIIEGLAVVRNLRSLQSLTTEYEASFSTVINPEYGCPVNVHALLRHFSRDPVPSIPAQGALYHVMAKVVKLDRGAEQIPQNANRQPQEYMLGGDIIRMKPFRVPKTSDPSKKNEPLDNVTNEWPALIMVAAHVSSTNPTDFSYTFRASQWTAHNPRGSINIKAVIPNESKWSKDKLRGVPTINTIVHVTGHLQGVEFPSVASSDSEDDNSAANSAPDPDPFFVIEVSSFLEYLSGRNEPTTPGPSSTQATTTSSAPSSPSKPSLSMARARRSHATNTTPTKSTVPPSQPSSSRIQPQPSSSRALEKQPEPGNRPANPQPNPSPSSTLTNVESDDDSENSPLRKRKRGTK
ncbi:hypothetical protein EV715DRAFT_213956 [Schizophyllum commune]